ncbi:MAG: glycoside hydrolase family 127 protein, partial [Eubacteriales bacterium]
MKKLSVPDIKKVSIDANGFFGRIIDLVRDKVIPYQWETLNDRVEGAAPSHCIENFKIAAGVSEGEFYGCVFQDSDLAKWIEAVAYS